MDFTLVVVSPFGLHASGDAITDAGRIEAVLGGEHADKVVRVRSTSAPRNAAPPLPAAHDAPAPAAHDAKEH